MKLSEYGETSSGSIASNPSAGLNRGMDRRDVRLSDADAIRGIKAGNAVRPGIQSPAQIAQTKAQLIRAQQLKKRQSFAAHLLAILKSKLRLGSLKEYHRIDESFDMNDVVSRLKGIENKGYDYTDTVTYGVEDEKGNIMKITVKSEQAADFENEMSQQLAQVEKYKKTGYEGMDTSLAELVYNLRGKFEIVNLEFPTIPSDVIYNADKTSPVGDLKPAGAVADDFDQFSSNSFGDDAMADENDPFGGDQMGGEEGGFGADGMDADPNNPDTAMGGQGQDPNGMGAGGDEFGMEGDAEGVEDFMEPAAKTSPEELLQSVMAMLTADANAKKAQADAEAEKARAMQAQYQSQATASMISGQEEKMKVELEMENQKKREKEAKELAAIAKYRVEKGNGAQFNPAPSQPASMQQPTQSFESFEISLNALYEVDSFATPQSVARERSAALQQYAPSADDDDITKQYKNAMRAKVMQELGAKMAQAQLTMQYKKSMAVKANQPQQNNQQQNPNQQQNQAGQLNRSSGV